VRRFLIGAVTLAAVCALAGPASAQPRAVAGTVTVFSTELTPLTVYQNPSGCNRLPDGAHVLTNQSSGLVTVYADPYCMTPGLTVRPGYGSHVTPGAGSFSG
jgi:Na+-transporting NADH:ubiquinone oxidoreductase subunit NqrA